MKLIWYKSTKNVEADQRYDIEVPAGRKLRLIA